jgi:DNA polymerase-3 subunit gamma/tau
MNQCDINYRQSSNKRLLVELTLIEIAQITQPDDEGASAGRRPRRLKTLFKQLMQQPQPKQAAPQVAAAEPAVSTTVKTSTPSTATTSPAPAPSPAKRPKLSSITTSWKNLLNQPKGQTPGDAAAEGAKSGSDDAATTQRPFDQQELELEWMSMCNRMPQQFSGIATRMKNMSPVITDYPAVEIVADNQLALEQMQQIKGKILNTLKLHLRNDAITLTMRQAEHHEVGKILTRREQYELMEKENPSIAKLRNLLDLQLA